VLLAAPVFAHPKSLCRTDEATLFSCRFGDRVVSVCNAGSKGKAGVTARVRQSNGPVRTGSGVFSASRSFSGGGEAQIGFARKQQAWTIYDRTLRTRLADDGHHDAAITTGLMVRKDGTTIAEDACDPKTMSGSVDAALPYLNVGDFFEH
jgi:hypothetical protein